MRIAHWRDTPQIACDADIAFARVMNGPLPGSPQTAARDDPLLIVVSRPVPVWPCPAAARIYEIAARTLRVATSAWPLSPSQAASIGQPAYAAGPHLER
jgi:hypothetical protein